SPSAIRVHTAAQRPASAPPHAPAATAPAKAVNATHRTRSPDRRLHGPDRRHVFSFAHVGHALDELHVRPPRSRPQSTLGSEGSLTVTAPREASCGFTLSASPTAMMVRASGRRRALATRFTSSAVTARILSR